jgi:hypothetical protein
MPSTPGSEAYCSGLGVDERWKEESGWRHF